jgi:hypothetical protein
VQLPGRLSIDYRPKPTSIRRGEEYWVELAKVLLGGHPIEKDRTDHTTPTDESDCFHDVHSKQEE